MQFSNGISRNSNWLAKATFATGWVGIIGVPHHRFIDGKGIAAANVL